VACTGTSPFAGAAAVDPDTVVATVNGRRLTAGDVDRIVSGAPPGMQAGFRANRKFFLEQYALVALLAGMAEEAGLHEQTPYKERLEWIRNQTLMQAAIADYAKRIGAQGSETVDEAPRRSSEEADPEAQVRLWLDGLREESEVGVEDETFFSSPLATAGTGGPDAVVATVNGRGLTAGDIGRIFSGASPQIRQNFATNRKEVLQQYALMLRLVKAAEKEDLPAKSPYKEQLEWVRANQLMQAKVDNYSNHIIVRPEDERDFYEASLDKYREARVKILYISFAATSSPEPQADGRPVLSEEEASAKIESLRQQVLEGTDFVKLVGEHSEDSTSAAKDGDFGTIRRSDNIPEHIKDAIFSCKAGEVSEVVRQPNGFYLFRVEEIGTRSLDEVRNEVNREAKNAKFQEWFESVRNSVEIAYDNEAYFSQEPAK